MNAVLGQLRGWWRRELLVRVAWGAARWVAVAVAFLALACFADWYYDRIADTPVWFRALGLAAQAAAAAGFALLFVVGPLRRLPHLDDLATRAERAIPEFGHRLVTALQLNRAGAKTAGMSKAMIGALTTEAGEIASRHRLGRLADFRPLGWAAAVAGPVLLAAGIFAAAKPELTAALLKRQALQDAEIPRSVKVEHATPAVLPTGRPVTLQFQVSGEYTESTTGTAIVRPDGQEVSRIELRFAHHLPDGSAIFSAVIPPPSAALTVSARIEDGRTRKPARIEFEPPPQVTELEAWQLLPRYLGTRPVGSWWERRARESELVTDEPFEVYQPGGDVLDALPSSEVRVKAKFNKPVARAVLVTTEQADGSAAGRDGPQYRPVETAADRQSAEWTFPITPGVVGYRIEVTDDRDFASEFPESRKVQVRADAPPLVELKTEMYWPLDKWKVYKDGVPPADPDAAERWKLERARLESRYEWPNNDRPLGKNGKIQVTWAARSALGIGRVRVAYRVIPGPSARGERDLAFAAVLGTAIESAREVREDAAAVALQRAEPGLGAALGFGGWLAANPDAARRAVTHPRDDADWPEDRKVFRRLDLTPWPPRVAPAGLRVVQMGRFVPDLGLFEHSDAASEVEVHLAPAADVGEQPGGLEAGGRYYFKVGGLTKRMPDGSVLPIQVGDQVEVFVEVYDKLWVEETARAGYSARPAGYTDRGREKLVLTDEGVELATRAKLQQDERLAEKVLKTQQEVEEWLEGLGKLVPAEK